MRRWKADTLSAAMTVLIGLAAWLCIEVAPTEWFDPFNALGPQARPWLVGLASLTVALLLIGVIWLAQRALKLPRD